MFNTGVYQFFESELISKYPRKSTAYSFLIWQLGKYLRRITPFSLNRPSKKCDLESKGYLKFPTRYEYCTVYVAANCTKEDFIFQCMDKN